MASQTLFYLFVAQRSQSPSPNEGSPLRTQSPYELHSRNSSADSFRSTAASLPPRKRIHRDRKMAQGSIPGESSVSGNRDREARYTTESLSLDSLPDYQDQEPPFSYAVLILLAIQGSPRKMLQHGQINSAIKEKFRWYRYVIPNVLEVRTLCSWPFHHALIHPFKSFVSRANSFITPFFIAHKRLRKNLASITMAGGALEIEEVCPYQIGSHALIDHRFTTNASWSSRSVETGGS